jgi:hypothetical protein
MKSDSEQEKTKHMRSRYKRVRALKTAVLVLVLVAAGLAQAPPRKRKTAAQRSKAFTTLPQLMREGLHEEFTFLSFKIWHDSPMTGEKMDSVAKTANRLQELANQIPRFKESYFAHRPGTDRELVDARTETVAEVARLLAEAAERRDQKSVEGLVVQLESACNRCHVNFKKELSSQYVEQTQPPQ